MNKLKTTWGILKGKNSNSNTISLLIVLALLLTITIVTFTLTWPSKIPEVVLYRLEGQIAYSQGSSMLSTGSTITPKKVEKIVTDIQDNPNIRAVVFTISSPGGSAAASQDILFQLQKLDIPIVVYCEELVASGGYYIAMGADKIVAPPAALIGSIGVISTFTNLSGLYEKLGIEMEIIASGEHKDMFSGTRSLTVEERETMQDLSNEIYLQFVEAVMEGRGYTYSEALQVATGELFTGVTAKELGLIDKVGTMDNAVQTAIELAGLEKYRITNRSSGSAFGGLFSLVVPKEVLKILEGPRLEIRY